MKEELLQILVKRAFLIPSCEPYGNLAGFYDYGPVGCLLKRKLQRLWRHIFLRENGWLEVETSHILPHAVLKASGHADSFTDPMVVCKKCKAAFREDEATGKKNCARCGTADGFEKKGSFNLMFKTSIGPTEGSVAYCRPETAQGIFLDFPRIFKTYGSKLPMAIGQIGHSYRNEISPRQGLIRMREFSQMEIEYFFNPKEQKMPGFEKMADEKIRIKDDHSKKDGAISETSAKEAVGSGLVENEMLAYFMAKQTLFYLSLGIPYEKFWFRKLGADEMPHYSKGNFDLECETSYGVIETVGNAYRTDFDLSSHASASKSDMSVFIEEAKEKIIPHVVEPSMGVDRTIWCVLEHTFRKANSQKEWDWFDFPPAIAPYLVAVFPLMKKDGLDGKAQEIAAKLRGEFDVMYSESGSIGKRYARADEIGTPYCITIDYDTLKDNTVTVRFRNDGKQTRVGVDSLASELHSYLKDSKTAL
jgi:glycyl-tRNA synthetase